MEMYSSSWKCVWWYTIIRGSGGGAVGDGEAAEVRRERMVCVIHVSFLVLTMLFLAMQVDLSTRYYGLVSLGSSIIVGRML